MLRSLFWRAPSQKAGFQGLGLSKRRKMLITLATLIGTFLAALDSTVVGTAMPTIIGELGGLSLYPWVFASYLLAATVTGPIFGKLSDTYGRKPIYLAGIFLFLAGSLLAGTSDSMSGLIAFRTLQGLGAGAVQPVAITIVGDIFELETGPASMGSSGGGGLRHARPPPGGLITYYVSGDGYLVIFLRPSAADSSRYLTERSLQLDLRSPRRLSRPLPADRRPRAVLLALRAVAREALFPLRLDPGALLRRDAALALFAPSRPGRESSGPLGSQGPHLAVPCRELPWRACSRVRLRAASCRGRLGTALTAGAVCAGRIGAHCVLIGGRCSSAPLSHDALLAPPPHVGGGLAARWAGNALWYVVVAVS